jgi:hypothetical protein
MLPRPVGIVLRRGVGVRLGGNGHGQSLSDVTDQPAHDVQRHDVLSGGGRGPGGP